jgi:membrane protease YdiL (CAAX protease family)
MSQCPVRHASPRSKVATRLSPHVTDVEPPAPEAPVAADEPAPVVVAMSGRRRAAIALGATAATTLVVTALSRFAPERYSATAVGVAFLAATWFLVLRGDEATIRDHGLSLGGILEPRPIEMKRVLRDAGHAALHVIPLVAIVFPLFWLGYRFYWQTRSGFHFRLPDAPLDAIAGQFVVIALPEEAFFRGYLQTELEAAWPLKVKVLGAELGLGWLVSAALFAIGHFLTIPNPSRLAVFFPALVFGWLRAKTKGVGAGVVFHALCNLFAATLARGYGVR